MDDRRFDALTRTIAAGAWSRRRALQGVVGGALATLLTHLGLEEASAACVKPGKKGCKGPKPKPCCAGAVCKGGNKDKPGRCVCKGSLTKCGPTCVNTKSNSQHCGGCHKPCGAGQTCAGGTCVSSGGCPAGTTMCGARCVDTQTDPLHCGGCHIPCGAAACVQGTCWTPDMGTCTQAYDVCNLSSLPPGTNVSCNQVNNQGECKCSKRLDGRPFCGVGMRCGCLSDADCVPGDACVECTNLCDAFGSTGCASPCPEGP